MAQWHLRAGRWWALQWVWPFDGWLSLGVHLDLKARRRPDNGERYGPYLDLHVGFCILSLGVNPSQSTDYRYGSVNRGGSAWTAD